MFVFVVVIAAIGLLAMTMAKRVVDVLPEVPRDQLGEDRWDEPIGIEFRAEFQVGHVPDCAADPISRIVLWDADSTPYWEVTGPAKPLKMFVVGGAPDGFETVVEYREPPDDAMLRLVVFRSTGGAAGIRYEKASLRDERVVSGTPLRSYTVEGFQDALVCSDSAASDPTPPVTDGEPEP